MRKTVHLFAGIIVGTLATSAFFVISLKASAQDPARLAPQNYRVLLENNQMRAIDYHLAPGEKEPIHSHPTGVLVYYLSDAHIRTRFPDGRITEDTKKAGDTVWRDPITHAGENIGTTEAHALLIEPGSGCN